MSRRLLFSVSIHDCEVQTFRAGGKGGQNQNKRETGVRVIHRPSLAIGEGREYRSQLENKRAAFARMGNSAKFQAWARAKALDLVSVEARVDEMMRDANLLVEVMTDEGWRPA